MGLSIIIPVHNTEQYLVECLDSVLSEINTDDEIILHCAGTNDSVGGVQRGRLYAKICTGNENKIYLKLAATQAESNAIITIKYRKLI